MAEAGGSGFSSRNVIMRAEKKVLSRMATKNAAKAFIDDETTGELLDQMYKLAKMDTGSKKEAEKLMKDLIKMVVKVGVLYRHNQFSKEELQLAEKFRRKFRSTTMTLVSFYEVDFTFDINFLTKNLEECKSMLQRLIGKHLTDKSHGRVDHVFDYFGGTPLLEKLFQSSSGPYRDMLGRICELLNKMIEDGNL